MKLSTSGSWIGLAALALPGCATIERISQAVAFPIAAAAETRVGANCIRAEEAGRLRSRVAPFMLKQGRELFNARHRPLISQSEAESLERMRLNTDGVCPAVTPPVVEPVTPSAEVVAPQG